MTTEAQHWAVVGAGVIGLSTAVLAQRRGYKLTIFTDRLPLETTSAKAAASFKPHEVLQNKLEQDMLTRAWAHFDALEKSGAPCGVRRHKHCEASSSPLPAQPYMSVMEDVEELTYPNVPGGYRYGRRYTTFFIDISQYIPWLHEVFRAQGGTLVHMARPFEQLDELARLPQDVVFNCTGLGARTLCNDRDVYPIKGQVAIVKAYPDMDWSASCDGFYVYPRAHDTVIGGTTEHHVDTETNDRSALSLLVRANRRILPDLTDTSILRGVAGLRPYRTTGIRLEAQSFDDRKVIHQYGHGGAGITLSWGSAELAVELAEQAHGT